MGTAPTEWLCASTTLGLFARAASRLLTRYVSWRLSYSPFQAARVLGHQYGAGRAREHPTPTAELSLEERAKAITETNTGVLARAADLTLASITEDGKIAGVVRNFSHGIPRLPKRFVGPPELVRALEGVRDGGPLDRRGQFGEIFPEAEVAKMLEWGVLLCGLVQKVPVPPSGKWGAVRPTFRIKAWNPRWLRYDFPRDDWQLFTRDRGHIWLSEHPDEFRLFRPHGETKPWELAHWKYVTKCALMARDAEYDRARHSAMNGPVWVGKGGGNSTPENLEDMRKVLETMERRARIVLQEGEDLEVKGPPTGDLGNLYQAILKDSRDEVAYCLLGNIVMTEGGKGFSDGDVWERMTQARIDFYASALERFEQELLDEWSIDNAGAPLVGVLYDTVNPALKKAPAPPTALPAPKLVAA